MTTQEQLEKIIKEYIGNVPIRGNLDGTQCLYINEGAIIKLAAAILSAIKIDEIRLRELWGLLYTQEPFENKSLDSGLGSAYINLIASHAQEIVKFGEE